MPEICPRCGAENVPFVDFGPWRFEGNMTGAPRIFYRGLEQPVIRGVQARLMAGLIKGRGRLRHGLGLMLGSVNEEADIDGNLKVQISYLRRHVVAVTEGAWVIPKKPRRTFEDYFLCEVPDE